MVNRIKNAVLSFSISIKILLSMLIIGLFLSLFLGILTGKYFTKLYLEDTYEKSNLSLNVSEQALVYAYNTLLSSVNEFVASRDFQKYVSQILKHGFTINDSASLQEGLSIFVNSNSYISSSVVLFKNGSVISLYSKAFREDANPKNYFGWDMKQIEGITFFPVTESPYTRGNEVIPIIFPIKSLYKSGFFSIAKNYEEAEAFIVILLDNVELEKILELSADGEAGSKLILRDDEQIINMKKSDENYQLIETMIAENPAAIKRETASMIYNGEAYLMFAKMLETSNLQLVNVVSKQRIMLRIESMKNYILFITLMGLVLAATLAHILSKFVTKPFKRLMKMIHQISHGEYTIPYEPLYNDEIGKLNSALNSMHTTILEQFQNIQEKEAEKFQAEINLMSEQVNPHFLYNTLESINMEVLCSHNSSASEMINQLSRFLRTGLSYGRNIVLLEEEINHVQSYLNIMNFRFTQKINFKPNIQEPLRRWKIIKYVLQPLVENAIIHGFEGDLCQSMGVVQTITINACIEGESVIIEVSDNGKGIDLIKAEGALNPDDEEGEDHFGLNNVYRRLLFYYGDRVVINFETIPFFKNSVIIRLPYIKVEEEL